MIIVVGNPKGGVGKTTVATNLAVAAHEYGESVMLVDADHRQRTTVRWNRKRVKSELPKIACKALDGDIKQPLIDLAQSHSLIVIDSSGSHSIELRSALTVADQLLCPIRPTEFDIDALDIVDPIARLAMDENPNLVARVFINMAPTHPGDDACEYTREALFDFPALALCQTIWHHRKAYADCARSGAGITEWLAGNARDRAIKAEVTELLDEVLSKTEVAA